MIVIWIKKNEHAVLLLYKFSHCPDSAIYIYLFMYMYFKKVKFHWNINYKHALKNFLVLFKNHVTLRGFLNLKKKMPENYPYCISFFKRKSEADWPMMNKKYLNRRKGVYAFVPCSSHCYSGTRKKILLYRLQFLKRNSSRRIVGDWEISCKQI